MDFIAKHEDLVPSFFSSSLSVGVVVLQCFILCQLCTVSFLFLWALCVCEREHLSGVRWVISACNHKKRKHKKTYVFVCVCVCEWNWYFSMIQVHVRCLPAPSRFAKTSAHPVVIHHSDPSILSPSPPCWFTVRRAEGSWLESDFIYKCLCLTANDPKLQ